MFTIRTDLREVRSGIISTLNEMRIAGDIVKPNSFEIIEEVLTVGDYIIECGQYVLIIERKTIADLAASIVDRRIYENHEKLLDAASTDCGLKFRLMYLIEGKKFKPSDSKQKVSGIFIANLQAKLDHLMMKDGCQITWTESAKATAERLIELGKNMTTLKQPKIQIDVDGGDEKTKVDVGAIVKKVYTKSIPEIQKEMLMCISGIGSKRADAMMKNHSFSNILSGINIPDDLAPIKIMTELQQLRDGENTCIFKKMLTKINGMSDSVADIIVAQTEILDFDAKIVAHLKRANGRRIGNVLANRVEEHLK
jgi:ERCC4-type nuclease